MRRESKNYIPVAKTKFREKGLKNLNPIDRHILIGVLACMIVPGVLTGIIAGVVHAIDCLAKFIKEELRATAE